MAFLFLSTLALHSLVLSSSASLVPRDDACPCGYKDDTGSLWRESLSADFAKDYDGAMSHFRAQGWGPISRPDTTTYQQQYDLDNVSKDSEGLLFRVKPYDASQGTNGVIHNGEIDSVRDDIQYGTFRTRASVAATPGVCFGFFTYREVDEKIHETDVEILTSDADYKTRIHYTNQPGNVNGTTDPDAYKEVTIEGDLSTFNDHRIDWHPDSVRFFYNGMGTMNISKNVPSAPSYLIANLWSDGGAKWTKGPPTAEATAKVQFIYGYFNSSKLPEDLFRAQCTSAGNIAPCPTD